MRSATILIVFMALTGLLSIRSFATPDEAIRAAATVFKIDEAACQAANSDLERSDLGCDTE